MPSDDDRRDTLGVAVQVGDQVRITSWGGTVRLMDVGSLVTVTGFTRYGNLRHDTEVARGAVIPVKQTAVARRDGKVGHQGNVVAPPQGPAGNGWMQGWGYVARRPQDGWLIREPEAAVQSISRLNS